MKKLIAIFLLVTSLFIVAFISFTKTVAAQAAGSDATTTQYLSASSTQLNLGGELFQFTGLNAFNLGTYAGANAGCGSQENDLAALFVSLRPNSIVRVWAFQGGMATNTATKQTDWTGLDRLVAAAEKDGVKLIFVLGDQAGVCDDGHWRDVAWYEGGFKQTVNDFGNGLTPLPYLDYVKLVVSRYKDSTAIAMWEPLNEPEAAECASGSGSTCYGHQTCNEAAAREALRSFFDTVGGVIKSIDQNHLVASGVAGNGQCGASYEDYRYLHESPGIDVATYHDYDKNDQAMPGDRWNGLQKRINQMKLVNKPLIIEEAGMLASDNSSSCISLSSRRDKYKAKMDAQFAAGVAGYLPWALTRGSSKYCNYDIGDHDPTLALLHDYPIPMGRFIDTQPPTAPANLTATVTSPTQITLNWTASTDRVGVVRYDIFRNETYLTSTIDASFTNTALIPGATYRYHVKGKDAANNSSGSSNKVTITAGVSPAGTGTNFNTNYNSGWKSDYNNGWQAPW